MSKTGIFIEVKQPVNLDRFRKRTLEEIWSEFPQIFTIFEEESDKEDYSEIIQYCRLVTTKDGFKMYVADCEYIGFTSESIVLNSLKDYSCEKNSRYSDVTDVAGKVIYGLRSFRTPNETESRKIRFKIPTPKKGGKVFFRVS